jgi:hypothetical protein
MRAVAFYTFYEDKKSGTNLAVIDIMNSMVPIGIAKSYHQCSLGGLNAKTVDQAERQRISHLICGTAALEHELA